jgi:hypothetical protein
MSAAFWNDVVDRLPRESPQGNQLRRRDLPAPCHPRLALRLRTEITNAIIAALDAHTVMSTQALSSEAVQSGLRDILLNHARLWEALRARAAKEGSEVPSE